MKSINQITLLGRVGQAPEVKMTGSGTSFVNFSVATDESYKDNQGNKVEQTEWHKCTAWGKTAEIIGDYVGKGDLIYLQGSVHTRSWDDKDGVKRYSTEVKVREVVLLGGKGSRDEEERPARRPAKTSQRTADETHEEAYKASDDGLPF
jgi:single-strand DNA-binding protein